MMDSRETLERTSRSTADEGAPTEQDGEIAGGIPDAAVEDPLGERGVDNGQVAEPTTTEEPEAVEPEPGAAEALPEAEPDARDKPDAQAAAEPPLAAEPEPDLPRTVGRFIADALRAAGVRFAFTVPGESFLGLLEGLQGAGIRVVATRHEGGAAFMAEAHGQLTGRPAAAIGTRAVGAANLAIGIHTARQDSSPMFALVGQVERAFSGREAFQEIDQEATIGGLASHAVEIRRADDVPAALGDAVRAVLSGRPGPALLAIPEDLLDEELPAGTALDTSRPAPSRPEADDVRTVLQFLASAEQPVILAGGGVLRARTSSDLIKLAELLRVPIIAGWRRGDVVSNDHPLYLGMTGFGAPEAVRERLGRADALLVVGCRLSEITSFGYRIPRPGQRWIHVDVEPLTARPGLDAPELAIQSDARAFLRAAVTRLQEGVLDAASADARQATNDIDRRTWEEATIVDETAWQGAGVHPAQAIAALRRILPDDSILATDAGNFSLWVARHFRFRRPGTFLGPTSGAMGYGLPAAIAAALVHRDRPVVAVAGDGGFAMTMAELETAVREKARVIAIVFDNERYGTIRVHQDRRGGGEGSAIATDLGPIDFAAIARACGARGIRVETNAAFEQAVRQALANDKPTVIQVALDRGWVSPDTAPPVEV
ncbi:MAG TPA: thiamine pyrophosphate-dependent enzyme [Candidatus Bathyarchaeia archaeon]|nr:thiamine pyrophosphate-dependent enzyme [Candidatus Bathyarchaeia archaeon]